MSTDRDERVRHELAIDTHSTLGLVIIHHFHLSLSVTFAPSIKAITLIALGTIGVLTALPRSSEDLPIYRLHIRINYKCFARE
jgi:hypothetical protein